MLKYKWGILYFLFISITLAGCSGKNPCESEKSEKFESDYMDLGGGQRWMRDCSITIMDCFIILILRRIPQYPFAISRIAATFQQGKTKIRHVMRLTMTL